MTQDISKLIDLLSELRSEENDREIARLLRWVLRQPAYSQGDKGGGNGSMHAGMQSVSGK